MEERNRSLHTELWHPYSRPEGTNGDQGATDIEDYLTDTSYPARFDRVTAGL
jgi:hypothetical protein